jgi:hypothetical protein
MKQILCECALVEKLDKYGDHKETFSKINKKINNLLIDGQNTAELLEDLQAQIDRLSNSVAIIFKLLKSNKK